MSTPILATKLYIPPLRSKVVLRPRLIERLNEGLGQNQGFARKLTLISAAAGFGKTTLLSEWVNQKDEGRGPALSKAEGMKDEKRKIHPSSFIPSTSSGQALLPSSVAWLSLDEGDSDPTRFLAYLIAALQTLSLNEMPRIGEGIMAVLQSPLPPPIEAILTTLLNEISTIPHNFVLVLDDYHLIDAQPVDNALAFLLQHLPPQMHLVIATREDPNLPLARLRARGQLTELRAADLRFTPAEAAGFLNQAMGLNLSEADITALETRTEGWIAGLQLAALALQGTLATQENQNAASFIKSFTGSHHFVLDYLLEEVLHQQSAAVQTFLLHTSILDRLCGPLCDAVCSVEIESSADPNHTPLVSGQETLAYLERANLFIVPLDSERRWYRYHHLFGDLLRQRLQQSTAGDAGIGVAELHNRASLWFEANGLELDAFHHALAAHDMAHVARLVEGKVMPLLFQPGAFLPVLKWLASLPATELDARPALWVMYASALMFAGQLAGVEQKLQAAEAALQAAEPDDKSRDLIGHIAATRASLAVSQYDVETIIAQSRRALVYLHPDNLPVRTSTTWALGFAYQLQGDRAEARQAYTQALAISEKIGHIIIAVLSTIGLGNLQEGENQLYLAQETYRRVLQEVGEPPLPIACEAHLGLARLCLEWNDLDAAQEHGLRGLQLARQIENNDRFVACELFLARLKLAQADVTGAATFLAQADKSIHEHHFVALLEELTAVHILILLHQGNVSSAAQLAQTHNLPPSSQARVHLAQGNPSAALAVLEPWQQQMKTRGWADGQLRVMVLQAVAYAGLGEMETAVSHLNNALILAEPGGYIRLFVDEGQPMAELLLRMKDEGRGPALSNVEGPALSNVEGMKEYIQKLLNAFDKQPLHPFDAAQDMPSSLIPHPLLDPLSQRELEVLQLITQGHSNREISEQLFLALSTVKGHNRIIFDKLQVQRRTEAVARARELGLL